MERKTDLFSAKILGLLELGWMQKESTMRLICGLVLALLFFFSAVYLKLDHGFDNTALGIVLAFGLVVASFTAFSERIISFGFLGSKVELAKREIDTAAKKAIAEIEARLDRLPTEYVSKMIGEDGNTYMAGDVRVDKDGRRYVEVPQRDKEIIRVYEETPS